MRPLGEIAAGEHGWRGNTFGPLSVAGVKPERGAQEMAPARAAHIDPTPSLPPCGEGAKPDAATAAASALLSKARKHDEQRERRLYDPWRERR